jgi:hypothetical protein
MTLTHTHNFRGVHSSCRSYLHVDIGYLRMILWQNGCPFMKNTLKVQAGSTHTWKLDGALFSLASVTWRQAVQRPTLSLSLLEMTQALESPGHRDFRKMCPGRSPRFQVHGDRITEDHRYVEFWFIHTLSLSVPSCARCWRCSIINITLNS